MAKATPYCMNEAFFQGGRALDAMHGDFVGEASDYDARPSIEVGNNRTRNLELVYSRYQNVDTDWNTPDGGRSMMMGDMIKVEDGETVTWHKVAAFGFQQIEAPFE